MVSRHRQAYAHLQSGAMRYDGSTSRGTLHLQDMPSLWTSPQEQACGTGVPLREQEVWIYLASGWRWGYQHSCKVSWGLRLPRSWRYGTAHQHPLCCWCSSSGESVPTRSCGALAPAECHEFVSLGHLRSDLTCKGKPCN